MVLKMDKGFKGGKIPVDFYDYVSPIAVEIARKQEEDLEKALYTVLETYNVIILENSDSARRYTMIKIEKTDVYGFEAAIRGMRNPLNSWDKSDSHYECEQGECLKCGFKPDWCGSTQSFQVGENDLKLMKQLISAGSDHSKFMRMITVTCDITAPMYWWKEMDTYKVGTVRNSCSTMHTIHKKEFELDDFSYERMYSDNDGIPDHEEQVTKNVLKYVIRNLNYSREAYLETGSKRAWYNMIQILPSSYNQRATWQANYAVLRNIYHARKNHKLDEWHEFCRWVESLPYSELITYNKEDEING